MWETTKLEIELEEKLAKYGSDGKALHARYVLARKFLVDQVLPWIRKEEPNLTDHGPEHIKNVFENVYAIFGKQETSLDAHSLYILCQSILFHDVGNLFGRDKHNLKIAEIFRDSFSGILSKRQEMQLVTSVGRSHSGKSIVDRSSSDTLKDLQTAFYEGTNINLQELAAVLRFADELAEGPQRTSSYLNELGMFDADSKIYHDYASVTNIHIDKGGNRIVLSYHILLENFNFANDKEVSRFIDFMKFVYSRIHKLDGERRYCKHYSSTLEAFKKTSVSFTFWDKTDSIDLSMPPIDLDDLFIPGNELKNIEKIDANYEIEKIVAKIIKLNEA